MVVVGWMWGKQALGGIRGSQGMGRIGRVSGRIGWQAEPTEGLLGSVRVWQGHGDPKGLWGE